MPSQAESPSGEGAADVAPPAALAHLGAAGLLEPASALDAEPVSAVEVSPAHAPAPASPPPRPSRTRSARVFPLPPGDDAGADARGGAGSSLSSRGGSDSALEQRDFALDAVSPLPRGDAPSMHGDSDAGAVDAVVSLFAAAAALEESGGSAGSQPAAAAAEGGGAAALSPSSDGLPPIDSREAAAAAWPLRRRVLGPLGSGGVEDASDLLRTPPDGAPDNDALAYGSVHDAAVPALSLPSSVQSPSSVASAPSPPQASTARSVLAATSPGGGGSSTPRSSRDVVGAGGGGDAKGAAAAPGSGRRASASLRRAPQRTSLAPRQDLLPTRAAAAAAGASTRSRSRLPRPSSSSLSSAILIANRRAEAIARANPAPGVTTGPLFARPAWVLREESGADDGAEVRPAAAVPAVTAGPASTGTGSQHLPALRLGAAGRALVGGAGSQVSARALAEIGGSAAPPAADRETGLRGLRQAW